MVLWRRKPNAGLIHHTDRGVQYTTLSFGKRLEEVVGIVHSMGRAGSALENPISESFVASLQCELLHRRLSSREAIRTAVFDYMEGFYNRARRHSSLGYLSPSDYEQATMEEVKVT